MGFARCPPPGPRKDHPCPRRPDEVHRNSGAPQQTVELVNQTGRQRSSNPEGLGCGGPALSSARGTLDAGEADSHGRAGQGCCKARAKALAGQGCTEGDEALTT